MLVVAQYIVRVKVSHYIAVYMCSKSLHVMDVKDTGQ